MFREIRWCQRCNAKSRLTVMRLAAPITDATKPKGNHQVRDAKVSVPRCCLVKIDKNSVWRVCRNRENRPEGISQLRNQVRSTGTMADAATARCPVPTADVQWDLRPPSVLRRRLPGSNPVDVVSRQNTFCARARPGRAPRRTTTRPVRLESAARG